MPPRLLIRAQPLGRVWIPLGTDLRRGTYVEDFQCSSDVWGPADASFTLKRSSRTTWPDLGFWTPLEVEVDNQLVWSGRIISTPGRDADEDTITVNAQGWQYHLDDRPYSQFYVKDSLSDWTDIRSSIQCDLLTQRAVWQLSSDAGGLTITAPYNQVIEANSRGGYLIDVGPNMLVKRIVYSWKHSNNAANISLCILAGASISSASNSAVGTITALNVSATGTAAITCSARWIWIGLINSTAGTLTPGADCWAQLTALQVFADTTYESGNASILTASKVVTDVFARLPSLPAANIGTTSFTLPSFSVDQQTPRDAILAANAFQDWQARVREDKTLEYRVRPTTASLALTDQTAFDDLSAGSGDTVYNEVTYTGNGPDGVPIVVTRTATAAGLAQTIPDRLGVTKGYTIQSSAPLTTAAASQLCDVFLSQRNKTPFKGQIHATSRRSVAIHPSGAHCPTYNLLRYPGELVTFKHLQDPDTGALGRDGRIAKVTYTWSSNSAEVDIDSTAGSFEALLSRLAIATAR